MIECSSCQTLNPDAERACLACGSSLSHPPAAAGAPAATTRCPAGHPIDPSWKTCPYCDRLQAGGAPEARRSTRLEGAVPEPAAGSQRRTRLEGEPALPEPPSSPSGPRATRLEESLEPAGSGRRTVLGEGFPSAPAAPPPAEAPTAEIGARGGAAASPGTSNRRLVAVLAAPDLGSGGAVFPVRAGKTSIGADRAGEVVLTGDSEVSREHAVILHRNGTFHLADRLSTNGTWVNGREVPANGTVPLLDRDRLRCGKTEFVFLVIEPGEASTAPAAGAEFE